MNLFHGLDREALLALIATGLATGLLACIAACVLGQRGMARTARRLARLPVPALAPGPGRDASARVDALEAIAGIGPALADRLRAAGLHTFDDLARCGHARLQAIAQTAGARRVGAGDAALWTLQARLLAHGHLEAFAHLVHLLHDACVPLEAICEPIESWRARGDASAGLAWALRGVGVADVEGLAQRTDVDVLAGAAGVSPGRVGAWIAQARLLESGDEACWLALIDPRVVARMDGVSGPPPFAGEGRAASPGPSQAPSPSALREFEAAVGRWRVSALRLLARDADRACRSCGWFAAAAALALAVLGGISSRGAW